MPRTAPGSRERGQTLLILVVMLGVMIIFSTKAVKVWSTVVQREKEEELLYRAKQYAQAIVLYRKARGTLPTDLTQLAQKGPRGEFFLRQPYKDPITGKDFGLVYMGPNGTPIPDTQLSTGLDGGASNTGGTTVGGGQSGLSGMGGMNSPNRGAGEGPNRDMGSAFGTPVGGGGLGIMGVHSTSTAEVIAPAKWNNLEHYNEWVVTTIDIAGGGVAGMPGVAPVQPPGGGIPPGGPPMGTTNPGGVLPGNSGGAFPNR